MSNRAAQNMFLEAQKRATEEAAQVKGQEISQPIKKQGNITEKSTHKVTPISTRERGKSRDVSSDTSRKKLRGSLRELPSREEIQEFSFRLRDDLKVKVQAEVPYQWQDELEEIALQLDVKKLELYRYILGEFLGKVKRKDQP